MSRVGACESIQSRVSWQGCVSGLDQGDRIQGIESIASIVIHSTGVSTLSSADFDGWSVGAVGIG